MENKNIPLFTENVSRLFLYLLNSDIKNDVKRTAKVLNIAHASLCNKVKQLEPIGLISKKISGREIHLELTDKGKEVAILLEQINKILVRNKYVRNK